LAWRQASGEEVVSSRLLSQGGQPYHLSTMATPKHILIVEDDEDTRIDLSDHLQTAGYQVFLASEGTGAIQRLLENPQIDTIVTDVRMPVFGGDYWLAFLQKFCVGRYGIVLATARHLDQAPPGMHLVKKPYSFSELKELLQTLK